ncbi:MAG: hypothetical protein K0S33_2437 [Bacteroidetes bacterium]|jgi:hypothetical protein|nr:hypothetical protein [Bacteroidota bacterium]
MQFSATNILRPKILLCILLLPLLNSCIILLFGAGTLGGFDQRVFPANKRTLEWALDALYEEYPEYAVPGKWKHFDDWTARGYDFLDTRIFYFASSPEEMYYVSFIGDSAMQANYPDRSILAVRAVHNGTGGWKLREDIKRGERERIEDRFHKEIIAKLEEYTHTEAIRKK